MSNTAKAAASAVVVTPANVEQTGNTVNSMIQTMQANPYGALCFVIICAAVAYIVTSCLNKRS